MRPYCLRQSVRCPKKYGETLKKREFMMAPAYDLEHTFEQEADQQRPLADRYKRNAADIPDLNPPVGATDATNEETDSCAPLMIHGFSVPDYERTYHSVVDPLLFNRRGKLLEYSLKLGHAIKEQLFQELAYPLLQISEHPNGKVEVMERYCVLRPTPYINIDCKAEHHNFL